MEVKVTIKSSNMKLGEAEETNKNNEKVLSKMDENGNKKEPSEGEASSDFETVSLISSKNDLDGLDLDVNSENKDNNMVVRIENELAIQHLKYKQNRKQNSCLHNYDYSGNLDKSNSRGRSDCYLNESTRLRYGRCTTTDDKPKAYASKRRCEEEKSRSFRRSWRSTDREEDDHDRRKLRKSYDRELRRSRDYSHSRSRRFRSLERKSRSRSPTHRDSKKRKKEGRVWEDFNTYQDTPKLHLKKRSDPGRENKFANDVKKDASEIFSSSFSEVFGINNKFPTRKKNRRESNVSASKPTTPEPRDLQRQKFTRSGNDDESDKRFEPLNIQNKGKDRMPLAGKLGLKVAEMMKKSVEEKRVQINVASIPDPPSPPTQSFSNPVAQFPVPNEHPNVGRPLLYSLLPSLSTDKLPLLPGPTGLPVYVTMLGEQIPHDVDGRRIPVGPNGHYLPLDPTGRLFPHIVTPGNVAVPIYMSDDGVLRLPNSEPVPFGPSHQLPINIDGRIIVMGPDSKPLNPCPNIPKHPPLQFYPEFAAQFYSGVGMNSPSEASALHPLTQNKISVSQTRQDVVRCSELQKIVGVNPVEGGIIRSTPLKVEGKEIIRSEECCDSDSNMDLDFSDSEPLSVSKSTGETGGSRNYKGMLNPDEEGDPQTVCGVLKNNNPEVSQVDAKVEDPIVKKIQLAIRSLKKDLQPSLFGRFILFNPFPADSLRVKFQYESPLLRNRIKLPFITECFSKDVSKKVEEPSPDMTFGFLDQRKGSQTSENPFRQIRSKGKMNPANKFPSVFALDFGLQCDFTSEAIRSLNEKVFEATQKIIRLKKANAKLLKNYSQVQADYEKKSLELKKAYSELAEKNSEMCFYEI